MKRQHSRSDGDDAVDLVLGQAIAEMREGFSVPPAWRAELLSKLPTRPRRSAFVRWAPMSLAAALCLGVGLTAAFMGDGRWAMGDGSRHSVATSEASGVRFSIRAPMAGRVSLVGDFDRWDPDALPMRRGGDGETWTVDVHLPPGRHVFAYAVDGDLKIDPAAPRAVEDDFGIPSSVIVVATLGSR